MDLNNKKFIYSVVIPIPSKGKSSFDYLYDETEELPIGQVVKVPFGSKNNLWGVINKIRSAIPEMKLKFIIDVNHNFLLSQEMLDFIDWVSEWTMSSKGNILKLVFSTTDQSTIMDDVRNEVFSQTELKSSFAKEAKAFAVIRMGVAGHIFVGMTT